MFDCQDWNRTGPAQFIGQVDVDLLMMEGQPIGIPVRMSYPLDGLRSGKKGKKKFDRDDQLSGEISRGMIDLSLTVVDGRGNEEDDDEEEEEEEEEEDSSSEDDLDSSDDE